MDEDVVASCREGDFPSVRTWITPNKLASLLEIHSSIVGISEDKAQHRPHATTFLLQAEDDHINSVYDSLAYFIALQKAGFPSEMHLYAQGGHAFGLWPTKLPITEWPQLAETWVKTIGMTPK